jgi:hypothetical protein
MILNCIGSVKEEKHETGVRSQESSAAHGLTHVKNSREQLALGRFSSLQRTGVYSTIYVGNTDVGVVVDSRSKVYHQTNKYIRIGFRGPRPAGRKNRGQHRNVALA